MRVSVGLAGVVAASGLVIGIAAIPAVRAAASATSSAPSSASTLYVDFNGGCNNSGPGTLAEPFCTIQAAANVVEPGQTVDITAANPSEDPQSVTITRSGTPAEPITFTGVGADGIPVVSPQQQTGNAVVTLKDVHDVTISHLQIENFGTDDGIDVVGSAGISLTNLWIVQEPVVISASPLAAVSIDGASSDVTVSRTSFDGSPRYAVLSSPGARQVTLTTNGVWRSAGSGFTLEGTTGAVVTSNTIYAYNGHGTCTDAPTGVALADGSSGTVENNVITAGTTVSCAIPGAGALSVDASSANSAGGVAADYNAISAAGADDDYSWAGSSYPSPADLASATGQGGHDVDLTDGLTGTPPEGSPVINSANCAAPGELGTDIIGNPWVSDPLATDASLGSGSCDASRGAIARQDSLPVTFTAPPMNSSGYTAGAVPYTFGLTVTSATSSPWNEPVSYTVNFGDGSAPVPAAVGTPTAHQYTTPGQYTVTITATDVGGSTNSATDLALAVPAQPLAVGLHAAQAALNTADFTASPGNIDTDVALASVGLSCGGAGIENSLTDTDADRTWQCAYPAPGTYTATLTVTDVLGRTSTARATITVGDDPLHVFPTNVYSHQVAAHSVVKIPLSELDGGTSRYASGALVDVRVTDPKRAGYLTVYANGTSRPGTATVQFQAGKSAENSALAMGSTVDFYNGSSGPIDLGVTTYGLEVTSSFGLNSETYSPVEPASVLSRTKIAGGGRLTLRVVGRDHVPAAAQDVMLDITVAGGTSAGHFATSAAGDVPQYGGNATSVTGGYWAKGQQVTDLVMVPVEAAPAVLANLGSGSAYFSASVVGYYDGYASGASVFLPSTPRRLDTVTIGAGRSVTLAIAGRNGIPATGTAAVAVNLTAAGATASGTVTAYADGTARPDLISLSYARGAAAANAALVAVGSDGAIRLYNGGSRPVTVDVDLTGSYYAYP